MNDDRNTNTLLLVTGLISLLLAGCCLALFLVGCTVSMQNISTHGTATDLVDEQQKANADVSPDVKITPI